MVVDITERKRAEEAVRASHEMQQSIMDNIPQLIFWKDRHSVYRGCNRNFARAAGLSNPGEIAGKTDYDLPWRKEEADWFRSVDRRVMDGDAPDLHIIEPQRQADGKQSWVETNKIPLHDAEGRVVGILGTFEDITERRQAEEALRASEERLRTVVMGAADSVRAGRRRRHHPLRRAGPECAGAKPGEDVGKSMPELYQGRPDVQNAIRRALAGETISLILELESAVFETQFIPQFDDRGRPAGVVGVAMDVTERQWAEREILSLNGQLEQRLDRITLLNRELSQAYDATIEGWSRALDLRDKETEGHSRRVTDLTLRLADASARPDELIHIRRGALLHDIGKMGIPDDILLKPGPLTGEEWAMMQRHPDYAHEMLSPIDFLRPALEIPYCHHEKWDGTGYPRGLAGGRSRWPRACSPWWTCGTPCAPTAPTVGPGHASGRATTSPPSPAPTSTPKLSPSSWRLSPPSSRPKNAPSWPPDRRSLGRQPQTGPHSLAHSPAEPLRVPCFCLRRAPAGVAKHHMRCTPLYVPKAK